VSTTKVVPSAQQAALDSASLNLRRMQAVYAGLLHREQLAEANLLARRMETAAQEVERLRQAVAEAGSGGTAAPPGDGISSSEQRPGAREASNNAGEAVANAAAQLPQLAFTDAASLAQNRVVAAWLANATGMATPPPTVAAWLKLVDAAVASNRRVLLPLPPMSAALPPRRDAKPPRAAARADSDLARVAARLPESKPESDWAAPPGALPTAYSYYHRRPGAAYQCRALGQLDFQLYPTLTTKPSASATQAEYGPWAMKHPRFIDAAHVAWWNNFAVVLDRQAAGCASTTRHPAAARAQPKGVAVQEASAAGRARRPSHDGWLGYCEPSFVAGSIRSVDDAVVAEPRGDVAAQSHVCDQSGNLEVLLANGAAAVAASGNASLLHVPTLVWGVIPATPFVQHFVQNALPKLAALALTHPHLFPLTVADVAAAGRRATPGPSAAADGPRFGVVANQELLLGRFPIINAFYDRLGWLPPVDIRYEALAADTLLYPCNTPPLHPLLWQLATTAVLRLPPPKPLEERRKLVYCGRTHGGKIENAARRVLNEDHLLRVLRAWTTGGDAGEGSTAAAPLELVEFDHTRYPTLDALIEFWADARGLVGPHGGCLTNVVFMPCNSLVVELMPLLAGVKPAGVPHHATMMYTQATLLEHEYWMLPSPTASWKGDFDADLDGLCRILAASLGLPPRHRSSSTSTDTDGADAAAAAACHDLVARTRTPSQG